MPRGNSEMARQHRAWLRTVLAHTGLSASALARRVQIAPSTLTRPLREGDNGLSTLHAATVAKIAAYSGVAPPWLAGDAPRAQIGDDVELYTASDTAFGHAVHTLLSAHARGSAWRVRTRALELAGYLPGDVVLVDPARTARSGDVACARVAREPHACTVLRMVERIGAADVMVAATLDPSIIRHLPIDDRTVIVGVVIGAIRPDPRGP